MSDVLTQEGPVADPVGRDELERILAVQRAALQREGIATAEVRRSRIDRLTLAVLEHSDELYEALDLDYGHRPVSMSKAFESLGWLADANDLRKNLHEWMKPVPLVGGYIQQKPLGVVGVIGAWNFPVVLTVQPALSAIAAGNRIIIKFPDFHVRTGKVFEQAVAKYLSEEEVAVVLGDLDTAREFSELQLDHIIFTGSPNIGKIVSVAAARNLVPVTLELGGKNPVVVARDADLDLTTRRVAQTRMLNGGQICVCPDYVFVPRENAEIFVTKLMEQLFALFPDYLNNPGVVSIVNDRNYDRVVGLISDAVARGATKLEAVNQDEQGLLPSRENRLIPPTVLLGVPDSAAISNEEIFGPVIPILLYDDISEVISYVSSRPAPLAAYWYGSESADFENFLTFTTSGGVTRNDAFLHGSLEGGSFGGVGNSGTGGYHGKAGFDQFTHRRSVAYGSDTVGVGDNLTGRTVASTEMGAGLDQAIQGAIADIRSRMK